ncbi:MAG TPA: T9SS type A sorting domain-containing protein [Candidatus Kapabacteria bacterium]|nr:T9SS type A sorting domain-containing protein [Candidatus Kapabacteria bacterium]
MMKCIIYLVAALVVSMSATSAHAQFLGTPTVLGSIPSPPFITCYGSRESTKKKGEKPTADTADTATTDQCNAIDNAQGILRSAGAYRAAYDTAKAYLTLCYNQREAIPMFNNATGDANALFIPNEYREWLKSVLYLRMDSDWYCADVFAILSTFSDYPGHGIYDAADVAVVRYIIEHQRCNSEWTAMMAGILKNWPSAMYNVWRDTVKDSSIEPYPDTTVPSIDDIGLSILRGPQAGVVSPMPIEPGEVHISGLYATENPFTQSTAIKFTLADYGLVTFQLFDVLGHAVTTNGIGQVLYPGEHEFDIDGSKLPPGNYIARVAFHNGDVESIMVVKK